VYGRGVNLMAHSMGGLDCRYLISKVRHEKYTPLLLTTISTPHYGSPFMDWCAVSASGAYLTHALMCPQENIGLGRVTAAVKKSAEAAAEVAEHASTPQDAAAASKAGATSLGSSLASLPASLTWPALRARTSGTRSGCPSSCWTPPRSARAAAPPPRATRARRSTRSGGTMGSWACRAGAGACSWAPSRARTTGRCAALAGLQAVSLAIPIPSLPEWDWSRWLGAWRRSGAAKQAENAAAAARDGGALAPAPAPAKDGRNDRKNDGGEKLSAFFDWVAEQVPADPLARVSARFTGGAGGTTPADVEAAAQGMKRAGERNELATKDDLARFYVALCRKLYDEEL
jgi:triacylglycerol lipase